MIYPAWQMEFKHRPNIDAGLSKNCIYCLLLIVEKWNSSSTNGGTSTTAVQHTITVNVHMHTSPANQNTDPNSNANASRQMRTLNGPTLRATNQ
eukprot:5304128-Ditylum_brightwellii.AAC.1